METDKDIDSLAFDSATFNKVLKASDMKTWLKQFKVSSRSSTVTGAFVAALLPHDEYDHEMVTQAMAELNQDVDKLSCVYCGGAPSTWDHLTNLVQDRKANGYGHRIHNLVPCCADCNSSKGGTPFKEWILGYEHPKKGWVAGSSRVSDDRRNALVKLLTEYQKKCPPPSPADKELEAKLMGMRDCILAILKEADKAVAEARAALPKESRPRLKPSTKG